MTGLVATAPGEPSASVSGRTAMGTFAAAAATAVAVAALIYFPDREDGSGAVLGGLSALFAVALGLAAVGSARPLPRRAAGEHARLAVRALGLGVVLGIANLLANYGMAMTDAAVRAGMVERWARFSAWSIVVREPIMEEIAFRLVLMGGVAWLVGRFTADRRTVFLVALGVSASLFGLVHILYPMPGRGVVGLLYATGVVVKSGAAGLLLGWVFWRWGLPYSIACHGTANGAHLVLAPLLF